jgi:hypothetical protein
VPLINGYFDGTKNKLSEFGRRWRKGVETTLTWTVEQEPPHFLIHNKKDIGVKLNKGVIVKSKSMNRNKIFVGGGNMKDIVQSKITGGSGDNRIANTSNVHT